MTKTARQTEGLLELSFGREASKLREILTVFSSLRGVKFLNILILILKTKYVPLSFFRREGYVVKKLEYCNSHDVRNHTKKKQAKLKFSLVYSSHLKN